MPSRDNLARSGGPRSLGLALFAAAVLWMSWCYFGIPAPERSQFVARALDGWKVLFH